MKMLFILCVVAGSPLFFHADGSRLLLDPTGTYILKGNLQKGRIVGHSGELRAKLLNPARVALSFYINKGYPGYESGSFLDTLNYHDDLAAYKPSGDRGCTIIFCFSIKDVEVSQTYSDPRSGCGFGRGIMVSGFFKKSSDEKPIIQDLAAHGITP